MQARRLGRRVSLLAAPALLILSVVYGVSVSTSASSPVPSPQSIAASAPLTAQPGQAIHIVVKTYERQAPDKAMGGPPHAAPATLYPETVVRETWGVAGANGRLARVVTYNRDGAGRLFEQAIIDGAGRLVSYNLRHGVGTETNFGQPGAVSSVDTRPTNLSRTLATQGSRSVRQMMDVGQPATVVETRSTPDAAWLQQAKSGGTPYAGDITVKTFSNRLTFDQRSGDMRREELVAITDRGEERVIHSREWLRVEVLRGDQLPADVQSLSIPKGEGKLTAVPVKQFSQQDASRALPFALYVLGGEKEQGIAYTTGQQVDLATLPLAYRSLQFSVARGDAASVTYKDEGPQRHFDLIQGPAGRIATSLREAEAFWDSAKPVSVTIGGTAVNGWYLTSAPTKVTDNPASGIYRDVPSPSYVLLPDVQGTGVLLRTVGYSEAEILTLVGHLQRAA